MTDSMQAHPTTLIFPFKTLLYRVNIQFCVVRHVFSKSGVFLCDFEYKGVDFWLHIWGIFGTGRWTELFFFFFCRMALSSSAAGVLYTRGPLGGDLVRFMTASRRFRLRLVFFLQSFSATFETRIDQLNLQKTV